MKRRVPLRALAVTTLLVGCNATLGVEDDYHRGATVGEECAERIDCLGGELCLFKRCVQTCTQDGDCPAGFRCLNTTNQGVACVSSAQSACTGPECPEGTRCYEGQCRSTCGDATGCAADQECQNGMVCVGTDPGHDPSNLDGGAGGAAGVDAGAGGGTGTGGAGGTPATGGSDSGGTSSGGTSSGGASGAGGTLATGGTNSGGTSSGGTSSGSTSSGGVGGAPGSGPVGTPGQACTPEGAYACAGNAQHGQLVCSSGKWAANGTCPAGNNCDTSAGNVGFCEPIVAECVSKTPGTAVCQGQDVAICGPDLVTATPTTTCTGQACVNGACGGSCTPGTTRCNALQPQTCDASGIWQDTGSACQYVCVGASATCTGVCAPGTTRCNALQPQTCDASGIWQDTGSASGACTVTPPSCQELATTCGPSNESCCASLAVTGGTFYRSYDGVMSDYTSQAYPATVSDFRLDKYEVTVGRFRKFKAAWDGGWRPSVGAGKHAHLNGGSGLTDSSGTTTYEQGWDATWTASVAPTDTNLRCNSTYRTWTSAAGANEDRPINCVNWWESYAFCIWDGGFLPSEAEWNYAASGGSEQRVYPWSSPASSTTIDCSYANYWTGCYWSTNDVGSESPRGNGRYGQADLGGNLREWNLDWYKSPYTYSCIDCAYLPGSASSRVVRGGSFGDSASALLSSVRSDRDPALRYLFNGARCARTP